MNWFLLSVAAPLFWSVLNHVDKYLVSKYKNEVGVGGLAVTSSIFAVFVVPIVYFIDPAVIHADALTVALLVITGVMLSVAILLYLYALDRDDASHVVPFWFLIPVFAYVLGIVVLGEHIITGKILASVIVLLGAFILSLEFDQGFRIKKHTPLLMIGSSLLLALSDVIFKKYALESSFAVSVFWNQAGMTLFGVFCLIFITKFRRDFIKICKEKKIIWALNIGGEIVQSFATIINFYAMLIAPVALVLVVNYTFQPLFVFAIGIFMTLFFPHISKEHITKGHIVQKVSALIVMTVGIYLLLL